MKDFGFDSAHRWGFRAVSPSRFPRSSFPDRNGRIRRSLSRGGNQNTEQGLVAAAQRVAHPRKATTSEPDSMSGVRTAIEARRHRRRTRCGYGFVAATRRPISAAATRCPGARSRRCSSARHSAAKSTTTSCPTSTGPTGAPGYRTIGRSATKLTVNAGFRWDFNRPLGEADQPAELHFRPLDREPCVVAHRPVEIPWLSGARRPDLRRCQWQPRPTLGIR